MKKRLFKVSLKIKEKLKANEEMTTWLKEKDKKIVELTRKITSLKDIEAFNEFHVSKVKFLESSISEKIKLVRTLKSKECILIKQLEQAKEIIQKLVNVLFDLIIFWAMGDDLVIRENLEIWIRFPLT